MKTVTQKRLKPTDDIFGNTELIAVQCDSLVDANRHMRGHMCMVYSSNKWNFNFILSIFPGNLGFTAFKFDSHLFPSAISPIPEVVCFQEENIVMYVNVYCKWVELLYPYTTIEHWNGILPIIMNPAVMNQYNDCIDSCKCPSYIWVNLPANDNSKSKIQQTRDRKITKHGTHGSKNQEM